MTSHSPRQKSCPALRGAGLRSPCARPRHEMRNPRLLDTITGTHARTGRRGDLGNLNVRNALERRLPSPKEKHGTLFLPRYSPDNNPIEMAFSKLKALLRKIRARTYGDLRKADGKVCSIFTPQECLNYFHKAALRINRRRSRLEQGWCRFTSLKMRPSMAGNAIALLKPGCRRVSVTRRKLSRQLFQ